MRSQYAKDVLDKKNSQNKNERHKWFIHLSKGIDVITVWYLREKVGKDGL
jgi:hypothetical protein